MNEEVFSSSFYMTTKKSASRLKSSWFIMKNQIKQELVNCKLTITSDEQFWDFIPGSSHSEKLN